MNRESSVLGTVTRECLTILLSAALALGGVPATALAEAPDTMDAAAGEALPEELPEEEAPGEAAPEEVPSEGEEPDEDLPEAGEGQEPGSSDDGQGTTGDGADAEGGQEAIADEGAGDGAAEEPEDVLQEKGDEQVLAPQAGEGLVASGEWGECSWSIDGDGLLRIWPTDGVSGVLAESTGNSSSFYPWSRYRDSIRSAVLDDGVTLSGSLEGMFIDCASLTSLDVSGWDTSSVTNMFFMFKGCSSLVSLDVSEWNTSSVTNMGYMFYYCTSLEALDVSGWVISSVTDMNGMFRSCPLLSSLDVSKWETSSVTSMVQVFFGCSSLSSLDLSGWDTSKVADMSSMFYGCSSLSSLDVSGWNTSCVTTMSRMFKDCSSLSSLDLSGWETPSLTGTRNMFEGASSLATIVVGDGWTTSSVDRSDDMFLGCASLVGGSGTAYDGSHVDAGYARVDLPGAPGYLTGDVVDISGATVSAIAAQTYTGSALKPRPTVKYGTKTLRLNTDYTLSYKNNVNVGTATVTVTGKGGYTGTKSVTFKIKGAPISKATVSAIASQAYTGKAYTPKPTVKYGTKTLRLGTDYTLAYKNNTKAGTATVTITGKGNYTGTKAVTFRIVAPSVSYRTHVQNVGWQAYVKDGAMSGTSGRALRLEGINIKLTSKPVTGGITYRTHVQNIGWQGWRSDGAMSGTSGRALRLEAIQIKLTGEMAKRYDVYYRVHCQNIGWMGWAKNGQQSGSAGYAYRLEGIQIVIVPKGAKAPASTYRGITANTSQAFREKPKSSPASSGSSSSSSTSSERVLITRTGSKYHRLSGCRSTANTSCTEISISEARARGYEPCKNCYH